MKTISDAGATHAVFYTDGGCRPGSRGTGGWGVHGYFFKEEKAKQGTGLSNALPTPFGYKMRESGVPEITLTHYVDASGTLIGEATNNQAEIKALTAAMEMIRDHNIKSAILLSDSQHALQGAGEWMIGWAKNNWIKKDGQPVGNLEFWRDCHTVKTQLDEKEVNLRLQWVKGHNGDLGNYMADRGATFGVFRGRNNLSREVVPDIIEYCEAKGYWTDKAQHPRFFSHPNWYFAAGSEESNRTEDGLHIYYLGDVREKAKGKKNNKEDENEELFGKRIADATFSVLYLKEPEPVLELIRDYVSRMGGDQYQALSIGKLRTIFNPEVYAEILKFREAGLKYDQVQHRLTLWDHGEPDLNDNVIDHTLARDIRPARLAYRAIDALRALEAVLLEYLKPSTNTQIRSTDLTSLMYESITSKSKTTVKLRPHVTSTLRSINVEAGYATADNGTGQTKMTLTLSLDLPDRNTLAAIADENTKVTLLTWPESEHAIRYAVVIETDGGVGIWSGIYSNLHMLASHLSSKR